MRASRAKAPRVTATGLAALPRETTPEDPQGDSSCPLADQESRLSRCHRSTVSGRTSTCSLIPLLSSGSSSNPQTQAQQQACGGSGGSGSTPECHTSNADLIVPSTIAPVSSGTLIDGTICGSPAPSAGM